MAAKAENAWRVLAMKKGSLGCPFNAALQRMR